MLRQLRASGALQGVTGVVFGDMKGCAPGFHEDYRLEEILLEALEGFDVPVALGLSSGHTAHPNVTLPFGVRARLECRGDEASLRHPGGPGRMKIHLSAICGTAMASLAGLLREQGHEVTGSDQDVYPPMSTQLEALGIPILSPCAEANVPADADLVVIGNALSRGNPEVEAVLDRRQRFTSLPALLAEEFLRPRTSLVVAGTHGKTTTTSLLAFLLHRAGLDPSFLIGGVPVDFGRSYRLAGGRHFVIEGDEYDCAFFDKRPKFVHYLPNVAIIGNVEFDHADIYPDLAAVQLAFVRLMNVVPRSGLLDRRDARARRSWRSCRRRAAGSRRSASHEGADWRATDVRTGPGGLPLPARPAGPGRGRVHALDGGRAQRAQRAGGPGRGRGGGRRARGRCARRSRPSGASSAAWRCGARLAASPSTTTSPTTRRRWRPPSRPSGPWAAAGAWWPCSSRGPSRAKTRAFQEGFARAFAGADRVIVSAAHLPGKVPEDQRLSEAGARGRDRRGWARDAVVHPHRGRDRGGPGGRGCARATVSPSSRTGVSAASTTSCSEPSKPPRAR